MPKTLCCVPRCSNRGAHGFPANEMLKTAVDCCHQTCERRLKKMALHSNQCRLLQKFLPEDYPAMTYQW